jgi:hypothetical protein
VIACEAVGPARPICGFQNPEDLELLPGPGPPPELGPHGIHLAARRDGAQQLLVVNHRGRESVEFFELEPTPAGWDLAWRGCAVAPEGVWMNEVVTLAGARRWAAARWVCASATSSSSAPSPATARCACSWRIEQKSVVC